LKKSGSILFLVFLFIISLASAQVKDSAMHVADSLKQAEIAHKKLYSSPRKASIMSACLPGLGQIYNRSYWKVPVIYAGLGGFGYLFYVNNIHYNDYRQAVIYSVNNGDVSVFIDGRNYSQDQLQKIKLDYKKSRDRWAIGVIIVYLVNIIDANVDAHLKTFDVSNDLSLHIEPWQETLSTGNGFGMATGLSLKLNFK